jgi:hypothetical protein
MVAWALAGCTGFVQVAALVLLALNARRVGTGRIGTDAILAVAVGLYAVTGQLIISRLPRNAIGWLLSLIGLSVAASTFADQYALYGLATARGAVPAARLAGWCGGTFALLAVMLLAFLVVLFPDGRLPSRRWRPVLWVMLAVVPGWLSVQLQAGTAVTGGLTDALAAAGVSYPNPLGIFPRHGWFSAFVAVIYGLVMVTLVLSVISVLARRRGAGAELRKQLAWLGYVGLMTAFWAAALLAAGLVAPTAASAEGWLGTVIWTVMVLTPVAGIPLACVVAVLKYRLYEIDRLISRTVAYAIVTGLLVGMYSGLVLLATRVLPLRGSVAVVGSTLAAAALFTPLRSRVQQMVDRRFNRARYDADQTVAAFARRLKDAVDLDTVRDDLASAVQKALEPAHVSVWMSDPGEAGVNRPAANRHAPG